MANLFLYSAVRPAKLHRAGDQLQLYPRRLPPLPGYGDVFGPFFIGHHAFPIIGSSFLPAVFSLILSVFFQAIGYGRTSLTLSLLRQSGEV